MLIPIPWLLQIVNYLKNGLKPSNKGNIRKSTIRLLLFLEIIGGPQKKCLLSHEKFHSNTIWAHCQISDYEKILAQSLPVQTFISVADENKQ